jgi:hypothetical protein
VVNASVAVTRGGTYRNEGWRAAQAYIAALARPNDGIVFAPTEKSVVYEFYQARDGSDAPVPLLPAGRWGALPFSGSNPHRDRPADVEAANLGAHSRIWVVRGNGPPGGPSPEFFDALTARLRGYGAPAARRKFGDVTVTRYDARG